MGPASNSGKNNARRKERKRMQEEKKRNVAIKEEGDRRGLERAESLP